MKSVVEPMRWKGDRLELLERHLERRQRRVLANVLCRQLVAHGLPAATPAALIQQGTTPQQRVLTGDLDTLPEIVRRSKVAAPTLIIIGEVVRLRDQLKWFESAA